MSKYIELAKKLNELVKRGVGGEKINAEIMLKNIMKKYNISLEQIEGEHKKYFGFQADKNEIELLLQILKCVNRDLNLYYPIPAKDMKFFQMKGNSFIQCTDAEFIEIESKFDFYKKLFYKELDVFKIAFYSANNLLVAPVKEKSIDDFTDEELELHKRASNMSLMIKKGQFLKQIEK